MKRSLGIFRRLLTDAFWLIATAAILFGGYTGFQALKSNRTIVEVAPTERPVAVVETQAGQPWTAPLPIRGEGFVQPLREVALAPLSGGMLTYLHPAIVDERGSIVQGEIVARLDDSAEQANLRQTEANITAAEAQLALEQSSLDRARTLFARGATTRKDLDAAEARFADATARRDGFRAARSATEVAIGNKLVRAPFDGAILSKSTEVGAVVGSGQAIAQAFTDRQLTVEVSLSESEAALVPGLFDGTATPAELRLTFAGQVYIADGIVKNVALAIDARTRTLAVTIALAEGGTLRPADGDGLAAGTPPTLVNAFTEVTIAGLTAPNLYKVPSTAFHGDQIWLLADGALSIAPARAVHVDAEETYVAVSDMPAGSRIVTSTIVAPTDGMPLRDFATAEVETDADTAPRDLAMDSPEADQ